MPKNSFIKLKLKVMFPAQGLRGTAVDIGQKTERMAAALFCDLQKWPAGNSSFILLSKGNYLWLYRTELSYYATYQIP